MQAGDEERSQLRQDLRDLLQKLDEEANRLCDAQIESQQVYIPLPSSSLLSPLLCGVNNLSNLHQLQEANEKLSERNQYLHDKLDGFAHYKIEKVIPLLLSSTPTSHCQPSHPAFLLQHLASMFTIP